MDELGQVRTWQHSSEEDFHLKYPLHRACRDGDLEALSLLLLEAAAQHNLHVEDSFYGWTPLHWAGYFGKLDCVMKLLELGAHCDIATARLQQTPAHITTFADHILCLKWLIHCGANINYQDYLGETPAHKGARSGSLECLSLLASHGARLLVQNNNGQTAAQVAASCGHLKCAQFIEEAAARQQSLPQASLTATNGHLPTNMTNGFHPPSFATEPHLSHSHNGYHHESSMEHMMEGDNHQASGFPTAATPAPYPGTMDITLSKAVSRNLVSIAGKKRTREDEEDYGYKRHKANGENPFEVQQSQMDLETSAHRVEDFQGSQAGDKLISAELEPYQSVLRVPVEPKCIPLPIQSWSRGCYYPPFH